MSERVRVVLRNENVAFAGVLVFDGEAFATFGFAENVSRTLPGELIDEVNLTFEKGMLKTPRLVTTVCRSLIPASPRASSRGARSACWPPCAARE